MITADGSAGKPHHRLDKGPRQRRSSRSARCRCAAQTRTANPTWRILQGIVQPDAHLPTTAPGRHYATRSAPRPHVQKERAHVGEAEQRRHRSGGHRHPLSPSSHEFHSRDTALIPCSRKPKSLVSINPRLDAHSINAPAAPHLHRFHSKLWTNSISLYPLSLSHGAKFFPHPVPVICQTLCSMLSVVAYTTSDTHNIPSTTPNIPRPQSQLYCQETAHSSESNKQLGLVS